MGHATLMAFTRLLLLCEWSHYVTFMEANTLRVSGGPDGIGQMKHFVNVSATLEVFILSLFY